MLLAVGHALILVGAFVGMEAFAWAVHRYVMHGRLGWFLHASHHRPRRGYWEANDLFAVIFALPAIGLFALNLLPGFAWAFFAAAGVTLYGVVYALVHDGLVHRLHHAGPERLGAVSFGFLYAPDVRRLRAQMKSKVEA